MKKQTRLLITIVVSIVIALSVVQVAVSNSLSTTGITLSYIEQEIKLYKKDNAFLREKFLVSGSLLQVASKAASLGFVEGKQQLVVGASLPIAIKP